MKYITQSGVTYGNVGQLKWLSVSHDIFVQQENYQVWVNTSGRETHLRYLPTCSEQLCLQSRPPTARIPEKLHTCQYECQAKQPCTIHWLLGKLHTCHLLKDTEGWSTPLAARCNWGRLQTTAETAEFHTPQCCSMPHWSPLALATRGSALLGWGLHLPCFPTWLRRSFLAGRWQLPCPLCCLLDLETETLGLRFLIPHWLLCLCVTFLLDC